MNIEVKVGEVDLSTVIGEQRMYGEEDGNYSGPVTIADAIVKELVERITKTAGYTSLAKRVSDARDEVIRELVRPILVEAINEPVQQTNGFGEANGSPVTLRELILKQARESMARKEDRYGGNRPVLAEVIRAEVDRTFSAELTEAVRDEKAKAVAAVHASAATLIAEAIQQGIGGR